jgi:DNA-binding transcriptional LysR family regulator
LAKIGEHYCQLAKVVGLDSFEGIIEFVAVAETKGFSTAATQLRCSTSHVSRQVSRLEQRLGVALFARTTRLVSLTEPGQAYYERCKELVTGLQIANEHLNEEQIQLSGTLRVSAAGAFSEKYVVPALIEFAQGYPELSVEIDFTSKMVNFVEDGIDFAIRYGNLETSGLVARKLVDRPMAAAASRAYLEQYGEPTDPQQLRNHSCIVANNNNWLFEAVGQQPFSVRVSGRWKSNNGNAVIQACERGLGIAYLPRSTFKEALESGKLEPVLKPFWGRGSGSWIVYQNRRFLPMRARLAINFLVSHFSSWQE